MRTRRVPLAEVVEKVEALAFDQPDRRAQCQYVANGRAECIIGTLLYEYGMTLVTLQAHQGTRIKSAGAGSEERRVREFHRAIREGTGLTFTKDALAYMARVQENQDWGMPWGGATGSARKDGYADGKGTI